MWDMVDRVFSINVRRSRVDGCTPASHLLRKYVLYQVLFFSSSQGGPPGPSKQFCFSKSKFGDGNTPFFSERKKLVS